MIKTLRLILAIFLAYIIFAGPKTIYAAGRCYVNDNAVGSNNGTSWENAYTNLQSAIADTCTEIWVAAGTYKPHASDYTISFNLESGISLYGGFAGTETLLSQRNYVTNVTILSGDLSSDDNSTFSNISDNSRHVIVALNISGTILDGFTIQGGGNSNLTFYEYDGGGLLINNSNLTLENLIFTNNFAQQRGGGIYAQNQNQENLVLSNVDFSNNYADYAGGGIYHATGNLSATSTYFSNNSAASRGGGVYNESNQPTYLTDIIFDSNSADIYDTNGDNGGGGIYNTGNLVLTNVDLSNNTTPYGSGGGIFNNSGSLTIDTSMISNNSASKNGSSEGGNGGGIYTTNGNLDITETIILQNSATLGGGGISNNTSNLTLLDVTLQENSAISGGGISNHNTGSVSITKVAFLNNQATFDGGGMSNSNNSPTLSNTTFFNNSALSGYGGGFSNIGFSNPTFINVTIAENSAFEGAGGLFNFDNSTPTFSNTIIWGNSAPTGSQILNYLDQDSPVFSYSIIQGSGGSGTGWDNTLGTDNGNNLDVNPLLNAIANNGGFTQTMALLSGSPAIDAGDDATCESTDQRGVMRPQGAHCDIGAYEKIDASSFPTFADVPTNGFAWAHIESIYTAGITGGCSTVPLNYCPGGQVTRAQMAVFLLKGMNGSSYSPPPATGTVFNDVPMGSFAAAFIEAFATEGITGGCGNGNFCPSGLVTRAQMAVFLLKAKHGSAYTPPAATGTMFNDVPTNAFAAAWIEQLATEGITGGCGNGNYCPNNSVTRAQMAVFLQKTFALPLP